MAKYRFCKSMFPKKSSFKDWLKENDFDLEKDMESVDKIEGDTGNAKVVMKRKIYAKLNGGKYLGNTIEFHPLD